MKKLKRLVSFILSLVILTSTLVTGLAVTAQEANDFENLALNKPVTAFGTDDPSYPKSAATDGNTETRWVGWNGVEYDKDAWIYVDLEKEVPINTVKIRWENPFQQYVIETSLDG